MANSTLTPAGRKAAKEAPIAGLPVVNSDASTLTPAARKARKPRKRRARQSTRPLPHPDFPLFWHGSGRWAKKIRGKTKYFGKVADDPKGEAALVLWNEQKDALLAGQTPRIKTDGFTVEDLCDHFLNAKLPFVASGELTKRMYDEYFASCERIVKAFGAARLVEDLRPADFDKLRASASDKWGLHRVAGEVQRVRTIFKWGSDNDHFDRPIKFGSSFKKPKRDVFRKAKEAKGESLIPAAEIGALIHAAGPQLRAMILLGINCGFGNADCGQLPFKALDLKAGWVSFARGKTGIKRTCPLWPETVDALKTAIAERTIPKDDAHAETVFTTKYGGSWFKDTADNPISFEFRKLLVKLKLHSPGKGFYWLRHTFRTVADESRDQPACNAIMGHVDATMAGVYRERISDDRLKAVASYVRGYLFPTAGIAAGEGGGK